MGMPAIRADSAPMRRWTTAEVRPLLEQSRRWPRYELIDGELIVTPSPGWPHQIAIIEIAFILHQYLETQDCGGVIPSPADLELKPGTITQPDIFVTPARIPGDPEKPAAWSDIKGLNLAIEIISPSSARVDRVIKRDFYLSARVVEYWIVDLDIRMIERWTPTAETPEIMRESLEWNPPGATSALTIDLPQLFERIWMKYRKLLGR